MESSSKLNIKPNIAANIGLNLGKFGRFILPLVFVLSATAIFLLVGLPSFKKLDLLKAEKASTEQKLLSLETRRKNLEKVSSVAGSLEDNLNLVNKALPEDNRIPALLSQIQQISSESGVELSSLQYSGSYKNKTSDVSKDGEKSENDTKILVQASVGGDYKQVTTFFKALESARRILSFENVKLSADSKDDLSTFQVSLGLSGYYMKPAAVSAQGAEPVVPEMPGGPSGAALIPEGAGLEPAVPTSPVAEETGLLLTTSLASPIALEFNSKEFNKVLEGLRTFREYENIPLNLNTVVEEKVTEETPAEVPISPTLPAP